MKNDLRKCLLELLLDMPSRSKGPNYLYPSRGRKQTTFSTIELTFSCPNYLYPSRGRKHDLEVATHVNGVSELPLPLTGTETIHLPLSREYAIGSELPLPLTGTETLLYYLLEIAPLCPNYLYPSRGRKLKSESSRAGEGE